MWRVMIPASSQNWWVLYERRWLARLAQNDRGTGANLIFAKTRGDAAGSLVEEQRQNDKSKEYQHDAVH